MAVIFMTKVTGCIHSVVLVGLLVCYGKYLILCNLEDLAEVERPLLFSCKVYGIGGTVKLFLMKEVDKRWRLSQF